jgi:hypothetical protein
MTQLSFTAEAGPPTRVNVTSSDGTEYALHVALVILGVTERVGEKTPDGKPIFDLQVQLAVAAKVP